MSKIHSVDLGRYWLECDRCPCVTVAEDSADKAEKAAVGWAAIAIMQPSGEQKWRYYCPKCYAKIAAMAKVKA